ncbi:MAG: HPr family phosphocarrier protein [Oscillibacter sp.]|nr:HPr family phosphocarrier protein [Oscillibacter sp.]
MQTIQFEVTNPFGIHARPAAILAQACVKMPSQITVKCNGKSANGNNVIQLLGLHAAQGSVLEISAEGGDEAESLAQIEKILNDTFAEKKKVDVLKIAFFGTKDYDRLFFSELVKDKGEGTFNCDITFFTTRLTPETAYLAKGYSAVCIFVNDECPEQVVNILADGGVKLILLRCMGFNNVDLKAAANRGLTVIRVPAYSPYAVAEHAMSIIMAANRRLHKAIYRVKDNNFALNGLMGVDLHNKVAGLIGTGQIGQCFARICKGFGMTVIAWDAYPNQKLVDEGLLTYEPTKEAVLERADLVSLHVPLFMGEGGTFHIIDADAISHMKDDAMLVNAGRGALIDTEALIAALKAGKFHAVALDVYEDEDAYVYTDHSDDFLRHENLARLLMFPNVVVTSHQAFFTREALQAIAGTTLENARNFNEGNPLGAGECKA